MYPCIPTLNACPSGRIPVVPRFAQSPPLSSPPSAKAEYAELVETLLSSQRDAVIYQRLADAFNKLTASSTPPTMDRKQKVAFLKSLEEFVANVGGLLCVK